MDYSQYVATPQFDAINSARREGGSAGINPTLMDMTKHPTVGSPDNGSGGSAGNDPTEADRLKHALAIGGV